MTSTLAKSQTGPNQNVIKLAILPYPMVMCGRYRLARRGKEVTEEFAIEEESAQNVGFLRSFTQLLARLPLVLLAEALTGHLRSQGL